MSRIPGYLLFALIACTQPAREKSETVPEVNELPVLMIQKLSGDSLALQNLAGKTILILFNPGCDHCERQAEAIQAKLNSFNDYSLYFIASGSPEEITLFAKKYKLTNIPQVIFARAKTENVLRALSPVGVPTILIYSSEKKLVKRFDTETSVDEMLKYLDPK